MADDTKPALVMSIVVSGRNAFGESLCQAHGVWQDGRKTKRIDYSGPISSMPELFEALQDMFAA